MRQLVIYGVVLAGVLFFEVMRWLDPERRADALAGWFFGRDADFGPWLILLLLAPIVWNLRWRVPGRTLLPVVRGWMTEPHGEANASRWATGLRAAGLTVLVAVVAFASSRAVDAAFGDLPPAYHDEFSYLFQAKTFLAGRVSYPSFEPRPELFDQVHVLNEGRFASRYFPGVGLWIAPFLALGDPQLGHAIAHAMTALLLFWIGRDLAGNGVGLLVGLLFAVSPGMLLFSNLLLAHHPTLVGLALFLFAFLRMRRTLRFRWGLLAGIGLTYAMLCRPMTAAGFGLPFGLWFAWWWMRGGQGEQHRPLVGRSLLALSMAIPLIAGFIGLFAYSKAITGSALVTPYQLYTDVYTPRHVYGFNNVERGEQKLGPKVLENYDRWAENLTPGLAAKNVGVRLRESLRWTLGIVPLVLAAGVLLLSARSCGSTDWRLIAAAILTLHVAHIPYWFEGIMGWHYVLESAPLWILLFAEASRRLVRSWRDDRPWMPLWWGGVIATALALDLLTVTPLWPGRLPVGIAEVSYPRGKYARFYEGVATRVGNGPAVVFVEADPADRHMDYVVNDPSLDGPVLYARYRPEEMDLDEVRELFPDREAWLYRAAGEELIRLPASGN
ncbi:ArnT family glycosyltransferase [Maioricimonas rarisocia]|uniref:ArnT family glycosyltransferase n=1 Tax=Maioricimonas rarisocia TaxID=2528026 RepID=UPI0018D210AB|nr:glycosyltransferase family 39 protein [Maioricimonas rarisocia]